MLRLSLATGRYDRTIPLHDGRIRPEGLDVTWLPLNVEQIFWRMLRHLEFDASELSLSAYCIRLARGAEDLLAIPVFLSRAFRHSCIYVNADSGIERPEDLRGRRMGVPEFQITAAVWARGIIEDEHGVGQEEMSWLQGGLEQPGRLPQEPVSPPGVELSFLEPGDTLARALAEGRIDALISPRVPSTFRQGEGRVRRLFEPPWKAERAYFGRTSIFPIMHLVAIKRAIVERDPWVAQTLVGAFGAAKRLADADLRETTALPVGLPFLVQHAEETAALMGEDFWPYGLEPNRAALEAYLRYARRQGLLARPLTVEELFAPSTLSVSRI